MSNEHDFALVRERLLPMLEWVAEQLRDRTAPGYPAILDDPEQGMTGLVLAPGFGLYLIKEGDRLLLRRERVRHRTMVRRAAGREWFSGWPEIEDEEITSAVSDVALRDKVARLLAAWHKHPLIIRQSES